MCFSVSEVFSGDYGRVNALANLAQTWDSPPDVGLSSLVLSGSADADLRRLAARPSPVAPDFLRQPGRVRAPALRPRRAEVHDRAHEVLQLEANNGRREDMQDLRPGRAGLTGSRGGRSAGGPRPSRPSVPSAHSGPKSRPSAVARGEGAESPNPPGSPSASSSAESVDPEPLDDRLDL